MPDIEITKDIVGEDAEELVQTCPMNVYGIGDIEDIGSKGMEIRGFMIILPRIRKQEEG